MKLQAKFLERWTEQFLLSAGLEPGMRVLDLGCGIGDVSFLVARLVGPAGSVIGIDRDGVVVEKARERTRSHKYGAEVQHIQSQLLNFQARRKFDAVVGRYVLLYQHDPVMAIAHAAEQVRSAGIIVFHEMDFANPIRSYPDGTLFERMQRLIAEVFRRAGFWADLGWHLTCLFHEAGLGWPTIKAEVPVGAAPGSFLYSWITETLRNLLPRIEQFGLATAAEVDLDTLVARMEAEALARPTQIMGRFRSEHGLEITLRHSETQR